MGKPRTQTVPQVEVAGQQTGPGWSLRIEVSPERLLATVFLQREVSDACCGPEQVVDFVHKSPVMLSPDEERALPGLANQLCVGENTSIVVAQGTPAGTWADIDWLIPMGVSQLRDYSLETIDLHEVTQFINVRRGQPLCLLPRSPGPGRDVFGEVIAPPPCPYELGDRVTVDPQNPSKILASDDGCARFIKGRLSVEQTFEVKGDLTFKIGNIDFRGDVVIHGNVADDFRIKCTKDLVIDGGVGMSNLEAGGNLFIKGGVNGGHKGKLVCGGSLQTHYLHKVDVECGGDVIVDVESHDSRIRARGSVAVVRGGIIGGAVYAGRDVTAGFMGASMAVPTLVHAGYNPQLDGAVAQQRKVLAATRNRVHSLEAMQTELQGVPGVPPRFPSQTKTQLTQVQARLADALVVLKNTQAQLLAKAQGVERAGACIVTQKQIFPKVTLVVDSLCEQEVIEERPGPHRLFANAETGCNEPARKAK
jgi:uncharacterized protein (DUF342 family)